ncbi:MAG: ion channel [Clostridium sp.]|uniref:ion channel n=1 Tax=Clostridium sp. TaxID=1506 RepID=UPI003EE4958F
MGYFLVCITTLIAVIIIVKRNFKKNNKIIRKIANVVKSINIIYYKIFTSGKIVKNLIVGVLILVAEFFTFMSITSGVCSNLEFRGNGILELILKIIITVGSCILIFYAIGYVLLFSERINSFIRSSENKDFRIDFLLSYFLISIYMSVLIMFPKEFEKIGYIVLLGMGISYILNMKLIFSILINPRTIKKKGEEELAFSRVMIVSVLILGMIILSLYLSVCAVSTIGGTGFSNTNGNFSLFYYTIITFTTVGYGDIVPLTELARILSIIISITSVICITIFLSSILSYREKLKSEE